MNTLNLHFDVDGSDFTRAGEASANVKKTLRQIGIQSDLIRKVSIALYEGEINMFIHAGGGTIDVIITPNEIDMVLKDSGKGIADVELAMKEGFSTAPDAVRNLGFGAGMGLPNMKKNTDFMEVKSKLGVGTTVHMIVNLK